MFRFALIFLVVFLDAQSSTSFCRSSNNEIHCESAEFHLFNESSVLFEGFSKIRLTKSFVSGFLAKSVENLFVEDFPFDEFVGKFSSANLKILTIEHSALHIFPRWFCRENENLVSIEIDFSRIESIVGNDLVRCSKLKSLKISNSNFHRFSPFELKDLSAESVFLNGNRIRSIDKSSGVDPNSFRRLKIIDLSSNWLQIVSFADFRLFSNLQKLDLSENELEIFHVDRFLPNLQILDLRKNFNLKIFNKSEEFLAKSTRIYFPYAHFCCSFKSREEIFRAEHFRRFDRSENLRRLSFRSERPCSPMPDPMTPCESLFDNRLVRSLFVFIVFLSLGANLVALIINFLRLNNSSFNRWQISTILSSNLAMADFISSIYLVLVAFIDIRFKDDFHNQTQIWTQSPLCKLAGFIYIFGIQSSIYALSLLTFERFYTILFSFKRQTPWPTKFTGLAIVLGWTLSFVLASLPLNDINNFQGNSLCVPFRIETTFDRLYLSLLIIFDFLFLATIILCNSVICFNFSKSHVHTSNDARATLKILTLVIAICISRFPLILFIGFGLIISPISPRSLHQSNFNFHDIKFAILFLQPVSSCFNPFMYSSLSTVRWNTSSNVEQPRRSRPQMELSRLNSQCDRDYLPLRVMSSTATLEYRFSSSPNTP